MHKCMKDLFVKDNAYPKVQMQHREKKKTKQFWLNIPSIQSSISQMECQLKPFIYWISLSHE